MCIRDRHNKSKTFEYIFNQYGTYATIFDYPKSVRQIGKINGLGGQGCTNVLYGYGKKTFWNVGGQNQIEEFQVPQKLIKTLSVAYVFPSSCAMTVSYTHLDVYKRQVQERSTRHTKPFVPFTAVSKPREVSTSTSALAAIDGGAALRAKATSA